MNSKKKLLGLSAILIFLLASFGILKAQTNPPSLIVHPTNVDLNLEPGSPTTGKLYLINTNKTTVTIQTEIRNFTAQGEEGSVDITKENTPFSLASWIKITPSKIDVAPGKEQAFTYTITPPANAEPGGHFGSIVFATIPSTTIGGSAGSATSQEIATLFLARVPGEVNEQASIESFNPQKKFYEYGPVTFDLRVKDEGGVHIRPAGVVTIKSMFGDKKVFGFEGLNVLPGSIRKMPVVFDDKFLVGKYTADLSLTYGSKNSQLYATTEFFAFPWKIGIVILVVIVFLILGRRRIGKALKAIVKG